MLQKKTTTILFLIVIMGFSMYQNPKKETKIQITTSYGDITLKLYNETPKHRDNFIKLAKEGFYNETLFHRVIQNFMIQGGDPDSKNAAKGIALGEGDVGYTIPAEFNSKFIHKKGALAAARQPDNINPEKASSGCQFYIVQGRTSTKDDIDKLLKRKNSDRTEPIAYTKEQYEIYETLGGTPHLDMDYTVFGEVVEGFEVIEKIAAVEKDKRDRPIEDIKMTIKILK